MATFIKLSSNKSRDIVNEIYSRQQNADFFRQKEYEAAVAIQSWYRAIRCRSYLRHLVNCAITIQRQWRGYLGRQEFREFAHASLCAMRTHFYNSMAVRIQKRWRGYFVRRHVHNYHARKKYLESLAIKNQLVRNEIQEYKEQMDADEKKRQHDEYERNIEYQARKNHYMLSTSQNPGIYNSPFLPYPMEMELRLRVAKPLGESDTSLRPNRDPTMGLVDPEGNKSLVSPKTLPPLQHQVQGPFKPINLVQKQRYKPLNPSLRVSTDFQSLEKAQLAMKEAEWRGRITDEKFYPFSKQNVKYSPLLHTSSKYGHLSYGTRYFRESQPDINVSKSRMQAVVSPIPIFEKFGKTYSKGAVILQ